MINKNEYTVCKKQQVKINLSLSFKSLAFQVARGRQNHRINASKSELNIRSAAKISTIATNMNHIVAASFNHSLANNRLFSHANVTISYLKMRRHALRLFPSCTCTYSSSLIYITAFVRQMSSENKSAGSHKSDKIEATRIKYRGGNNNEVHWRTTRAFCFCCH